MKIGGADGVSWCEHGATTAAVGYLGAGRRQRRSKWAEEEEERWMRCSCVWFEEENDDGPGNRQLCPNRSKTQATELRFDIFNENNKLGAIRAGESFEASLQINTEETTMTDIVKTKKKHK